MLKSKFMPQKNAGYEIIDHEIYSRTYENDGKMYEYGIAVAKLNETNWVTWEYTTVSLFETLLSRSFFWGHYSTSKERCLHDYHDRLSLYYRNADIEVRG